MLAFECFLGKNRRGVKNKFRFYLFCNFTTYGLRPLTSWRFAHTRPRGNQRLFPLGTPSRPATFSNSEKVAMGLALALTCICRPPRPYSKMLTLPMVHPVPRKLAGHPWPAHAIFFNGLKFRVEFRLFNQGI